MQCIKIIILVLSYQVLCTNFIESMSHMGLTIGIRRAIVYCELWSFIIVPLPFIQTIKVSNLQLAIYLEYTCISLRFHHSNNANGFFIPLMKIVASNKTTTICSCKQQTQINLYEHPFP